MVRHGFTSKKVTRFRCLLCFKTFSWKRPDVSIKNSFVWFKLWIQESDSIRRLSQLSGHSPFKLKQIKNFWLSQKPPHNHDLATVKYILLDGTYFHRENCFIAIMHSCNSLILDYLHTAKESYKLTKPWLEKLKAQGLSPLVITMDGELSIIRAIRDTWPHAKIQRCLYHIQREGMRWLRTYPKTQAGSELRALLSTLTSIKSFKDRDTFIHLFDCWINANFSFVLSLPNSTVEFKDLKRTVALIRNALPDMFHYLQDPNIPSTTNSLEGFFSHLKTDYQRHRGLSKNHRISYLNWYCHFKNLSKNHTF